MNEHLAALQTWIGEEGLDLAYISDRSTSTTTLDSSKIQKNGLRL